MGSMENYAISAAFNDMDGTIYLGNQLLPGAQSWLDLLNENGIPYYFLTNNSSRSRLNILRNSPVWD